MILPRSMKQLFYIILITTSIFFAGSCKKKATKIDTNFRGTWVHRENPNSLHQIEIAFFSKGSYTIYDPSYIKQDSLENKPWVIKDHYLFCGRSRPLNWRYSWRFTLNQYPDTANVLMIDQYDTVFPGDRYMILDGNYFVDHQ